MGRLAKFGRILYQIYLVVLFAIPLLFLYPYYRWLLKRERFDRVYRCNRWMALYFSHIAFIPAKVRQDQELPDGSFIICPNHSSYLDILYLMIPFERRFVFLGKGEILEWPYFSMFFRSMNIPVPRHSHRKAHDAFLRAGEVLDSGVPIALFPEGTIPPQAPELGHFKNGAFKLSKERGVPIVPVTFLDHSRIFPEGRGFWGSIRPGTSRVHLHEAIHPEGKSVEELKEITRESIASGWKKVSK